MDDSKKFYMVYVKDNGEWIPEGIGTALSTTAILATHRGVKLDCLGERITSN